MTVQYIIKSPDAMVRYLACNLLTKKYVFYSTSWIPDNNKDPLIIDARLLMLYDAHLSKEKQYRRSKAGFAKVKYLRCGQLCIIIATKGRSSFFNREAWKDIREAPLHLEGYSISVNRQTEKVSVRLHPEAQRRLKREFTELAKETLSACETTVREFPFLPFAGVRDGLFSLIRHLNECRRLLKKAPVDWKRCVRKKFTPEPVFIETPKEIADLLRYEAGRR